MGRRTGCSGYQRAGDQVGNSDAGRCKFGQESVRGLIGPGSTVGLAVVPGVLVHGGARALRLPRDFLTYRLLLCGNSRGGSAILPHPLLGMYWGPRLQGRPVV